MVALNYMVYVYVCMYVHVYNTITLSPVCYIHRPLYYVGMEIFNEFQVQDVLCVEDSVVKSWLKVR